jgi:transposase InsO family protein
MSADEFCRICVLGKITHKIPPPHGESKASHGESSSRRSSRAFEIVYSDLSGISPVPSFGDARYFISFIDDFTRMAWIVFLKTKAEAGKAIQDFVAMVETQFNVRIARYFTDNGTEYVNLAVSQFFLTKGIVHDK